MGDLCSLNRLAGQLGVTRRWLREQAEAGRIPCLRAGRRYLFNGEAVLEVLAAQAAGTRQESEADNHGQDSESPQKGADCGRRKGEGGGA